MENIGRFSVSLAGVSMEFFLFLFKNLANLLYGLSNLGIPLLVVSISFGVTKGDGYGGKSFCWLEDKLIWAFVVPAFLIVMVSFYIINCCYENVILMDNLIIIVFSG